MKLSVLQDGAHDKKNAEIVKFTFKCNLIKYIWCIRSDQSDLNSTNAHDWKVFLTWSHENFSGK